MDLKSTVLVYVVSCGFAVVMLQTRGIPLPVTILICVIAGVILFGAMLYEKKDNKSSFKVAEQLKAGNAFRTERELLKYQKWAAAHSCETPEKSMLSDLIARYRRPRIIAELLGVLALGVIEIVLFKEKSEGRGEPAVIFIVLGAMILLLYFAVSGIVGIKARRLYGRLTDLPDFPEIERSYMQGQIIGSYGGFIDLGSRYLTLITSKDIIPIPLENIVRLCRADVLTAYYTNSVYVGNEDSYFIRAYVSGMPLGVYSVQMKKFPMAAAFELLRASGLPCDDTIEMR